MTDHSAKIEQVDSNESQIEQVCYKTTQTSIAIIENENNHDDVDVDNSDSTNKGIDPMPQLIHASTVMEMSVEDYIQNMTEV